MPTNKEIYSAYCEGNGNVPIFNQPWWWEAVTNGSWDVVLDENNEKVIAAFPYHSKKKGPYRLMLPPQMTQYTKLILEYPEGQKYASKIGFEKEKITFLIDQLPQTDYAELVFSPELTNWMPFKWKGYEETSRYTYVIEDLQDLERVWGNFKENIRREIRKAEKTLVIDNSDDVELFYGVNNKTFKRQKTKNPYSLELFRKVDEECSKRACRTIYMAKDKDGNVHASLYMVWDSHTSYYLAGGGDPEFRTSGAHSLLIWQAIKDAKERGHRFDFKGSMIEAVERFFRGFGAEQQLYFRLKKYDSKLLKAVLPLLYD